MDLTGIEEGQEVRVFDVNGRRRGDPEGGWVGTVTAVRKKLFEVTWGEGYPQTQTFRLDGGRANDAYGHLYVRTPAQVEEAVRREKAVATMLGAGLSFREIGSRQTMSTALMEAIAATIETFGQEGTE